MRYFVSLCRCHKQGNSMKRQNLCFKSIEIDDEDYALWERIDMSYSINTMKKTVIKYQPHQSCSSVPFRFSKMTPKKWAHRSFSTRSVVRSQGQKNIRPTHIFHYNFPHERLHLMHFYESLVDYIRMIFPKYEVHQMCSTAILNYRKSGYFCDRSVTLWPMWPLIRTRHY